MKKYTCKYAKFCCGIFIEEQYEMLFERFRNEFKFYYECREFFDDIKCDASIYIVDDAYEGILETEKVCIHSSHSKNKKYLLNGDSYTQKDASLYANMKRDDKYIYYFMKETNTKIMADLVDRRIYISGNDLYDIFVYVYETLLSINIEYNGGIQLHGACCTWNDKGYIITGKSGGGKTTLMFNLLNRGGCFHSNDRVAIFKEDNRYVAYSIPIPVNMPINMMRTLNGWKEHELVKRAEDNTKIRFLVRDFEILFNGNMVKRAEIENVLVVDFSSCVSSYEYINNKIISDYVEVLSPYDENHPKWLPIFDYPDEKKVKKELDKMNEKVKIIKLSGNDTFKALEEALSGDIIRETEN